MIENIVQGIDIVVMAAIIFLPIIIGIKLNKVFNNNFWMILFGVLCILVILVTLGAYWYDELSKRILLTYYGFNKYLMMDGLAYENVKPENISRVNEIYNSMFGVSWVLNIIGKTKCKEIFGHGFLFWVGKIVIFIWFYKLPKIGCLDFFD